LNQENVNISQPGVAHLQDVKLVDGHAVVLVVDVDVGLAEDVQQKVGQNGRNEDDELGQFVKSFYNCNLPMGQICKIVFTRQVFLQVRPELTQLEHRSCAPLIFKLLALAAKLRLLGLSRS
jgi:hypothetical protein